jgi:transcriptional regulator with XRE-family HTH domain
MDMGMSPRPIGTVLKRLRERRGLSQLALAQRADVAQGYISALEAGQKRNPGVVTLRKLARVLGVPLSALLE